MFFFHSTLKIDTRPYLEQTLTQGNEIKNLISNKINHKFSLSSPNDKLRPQSEHILQYPALLGNTT